jgi:hypothetical protein
VRLGDVELAGRRSIARPPSTGGATLLAEVEAFVAEFVAFPTDHARVAVVLWTAHTHAVEAFESTPRLALLSPEPGSGKTRALEVLELLTPRAMHVLSASAPAIFRSVEQARPTLLFDEVDAIFGRRGKDDANEDLRALLNAGHRGGATIPRCVGPTHEVRQFPVYAAAALAGLGDLPDTLMSRSVVIRMRRRAPGEAVSQFRHRLASPRGHALGDRLATWIADVEERLHDAWPEMPTGVTDRPADCWEPLLAIADAAGGAWPDRGRAACRVLARAGVSREASLGVRLLADLRSVFGDEDRLGTETILERLHAIDEAPWSDLRGRPLDPRGLARRLGGFEVGSTKVKIGAASVRGYRREDLYDAWQRYCPVALPEEAEPPEPAELCRSGSPPTVPLTGTVPEPPQRTEPEAPPLTNTVPEVPQVPHSKERTPAHYVGSCTRCMERTGHTDPAGTWRCSRCRVAEEGAA